MTCSKKVRRDIELPALAALDSQEIGVHRAIAWFAAAGLRRTRRAHQRRMDSEFYTFSSRRLWRICR